MAQSLSFNTLGSLPKTSYSSTTQTSTPSTLQSGLANVQSSVQQSPTYSLPSQLPIGTNKGLIDTHTPTTPVKSITDSSGNKIDFHAPTNTNTGGSSTTADWASQNNLKQNADGSYSPINQQQNTQQYNPNTNNLYGQITADLANRSAQSGQDYQNAQAEAQRIADQQTALAKDYAQKYKNIEGTAGFLTQATGLEGLLQNQYNTGQAALSKQYEAATNRLGAANTQQQLQQQALQQAGAFAAPQSYTPTETPFNPVTGQFVGNLTQGQRAQNAGNIQSIGDLTQQKNQIQSVFNGAEANFKLLVDTAQKGGVNDLNVPAINTIQQNIARGLTSSDAVINFRNTLATVRSQYAQILGGGTTTVDSQNRAQEAIPDNISLGALQSLEQQLKAEATNRVAGISNQINQLTSGQTSGGSTGGGTTMFGSFFK